MSDANTTFIDSVLVYLWRRLHELDDIEDVTYHVKEPDEKRSNPTIVVDIDAAKFTIKMIFWNDGTCQIGAASMETGEILFDYQAEIQQPQDINSHIDRVFGYFALNERP